MIGLQNATSINAVTVATKELNNEELEAILVKTKLNQKQLEQILLSRNYSQAQAEVTAKTILATRANQEAKNSTSGLTLAFKGLFNTIKAHPIIAIIAALITLISTVVTLNSRIEEARTEWNNNSIEKGKTLIDETTQLQTLIEKYRTLASSGKKDTETREEIKTIQSEINSLVGAQADNLDLVNGKLETQNEKLNNLLKTYADMPTLEAAYDSAREETIKKRAIRGGGRVTGDDFSVSFNSNVHEKQGELERIIENEWNKNGKIGHFHEGIFGRDTTGVTIEFDIDDYNFRRKIEFYQNILEELRKSNVFGSDSQTFKDILKGKQELEEAYKKQVEAAQNDVKGLITNSRSTTEEGNVNSLESYLNYRKKLIDTVKNDDKIKDIMKEEVLNDDDLNQLVDDYLSTLNGFSTYYQEWFDEFGSESAKKSKEIQDKLKTNMYFFDPEKYFNGGTKEIDDWFSKLSVSDKDIIAKIDVDTDTANWKLSDWQTHLEEYKKQMGETVDETNNLFAQLMSETGTSNDPSFVESIEKTIEKVEKLNEYLGKVADGSLTDKERISLFKTFPSLTAYTDDLVGGIENLISSMRSDVVKSFTEQLSEFNKQGANDSEIEQLNKYKDSVLGIIDSVDGLESKISSLRTTLGNIKDTYDDVKDIIDDYNDNGYYTIDNLKSLLELEPEYLNTLINEKGQIDLNSQAYKDYVAAKAKTLVIDQVKSLYSTIIEMSLEEAQAYANAEAYDTEADSLADLISATTSYYLVLAKAKDTENNTTAYTDALKQSFGTVANYAAVYDSWLNSLSTSSNEFSTATNEATSALESQKDALEAEKDALEDEKDALNDAKDALEDYKDSLSDAKDNLQDLIDLTIDYIKQLKENEKDALQEQKDSFDEIIAKRKEALELAKEEREEADKLADKQNAVSKDKLALAIAQLDDSSAGKKTQKQAADNLTSSQKDLSDYLYEKEYNARIAALEAEQEAFDESMDKQIAKIDEYLDNARQLYEDACSMIDNDTGELYGKLWGYTYQYTTQTRAEFDYMWNNAQLALQRYRGENDTLIGVMEHLQQKIYDTDGQIANLDTQIENCETQISNLDEAISNTSDAISDTSSSIDSVSSSLNGLGNSISDYIAKLNELANINVGGNDNSDVTPTYIGRGYDAPSGNYYYKVKFRGRDYYGYVGDSSDTTSVRERAYNAIMKEVYKYNSFNDVNPLLFRNAIVNHHAKGTKSSPGGLSIVDEEGLFSEFIPYQIGKGRYSFLPEGNPVFSKAMTNTLFDFASDPSGFANSIINNSSKKSGDVTLSSAPTYHIHGNIDDNTLQKIDRQEKQRYERFKKQFMLEMLRENKNL